MLRNPLYEAALAEVVLLFLCLLGSLPQSWGFAAQLSEERREDLALKQSARLRTLTGIRDSQKDQECK